jgi:hypothetical protein
MTGSKSPSTERGMPTPDMTRAPEVRREIMSRRERQKLEVYRQEHAERSGQPDQQGDMPAADA